MVFDWALLAAPWSAAAYSDAIWLRESMFGHERWLANVLSNHDQSRQASRLPASAGLTDSDAVARAAAVVLLTIRGTPFLYYGEEIGLRDVVVPEDEIIDPPARRALVDPDFEWWNRDGCRSPMVWDGERGHGFTTGRPWLRFGDDAATRNVAEQDGDPDSVLATYRRLIALRRTSVALRSGMLRLLEVDAPDVTAWTREVDGERLVIVVNFADAAREVHLDAAGGYRAIGGSHVDPSSPAPGMELGLRPLEAVILRVD
jgi:alpha-glucosidase